MSRARIAFVALGSGVLLLGGALWALGFERGGYTMVVNADISAGVSQSKSCKIVESRADDGTDAPVLTIRPVGVIWMFHSERLGFARVQCGPFTMLEYTFEVIRAARLEIAANDKVEMGQTIGFYAVGYDANGRRISSDVRIDHWNVTGGLTEKPGDSSCEFPPWCGGPGPASFNATATAIGPATVEALVGNVRGEKKVTVVAPISPQP